MAFATCEHAIDINNKKQINPCKSFRSYDQISCQHGNCHVTTQNSLDNPLAICLKCCKFYCTHNKHDENHAKSKQHKMSMIIPASNDFLQFNESEITSDIMAIWCHSCQMFVDKTHKNKKRIKLLQQSIYSTLHSLLSSNNKRKKKKKNNKNHNYNHNHNDNKSCTKNNFRQKYKKNNIEFVGDNNNVEYDEYYEPEQENKKCQQCNEWKNENEGYTDDMSGNWYCATCWNAFNAAQVAQTWNCSKCTFINDIGSEKCSMCNSLESVQYIAPEIGKCFVCKVSRKVTPLFQCERCRGWKRYCSVICQQTDWRESHKSECTESCTSDVKVDDFDNAFIESVFEWSNIDSLLNEKINDLEIRLKEGKKSLKEIYGKLNKLKLKQIENNLFIESCELNWKQWKSNDFISWIKLINNGYFDKKYTFSNINARKINEWSNSSDIKKFKKHKYFVGVDMKYITIKRLKKNIFAFISNGDAKKLHQCIRKLITGKLNDIKEEYKYDGNNRECMDGYMNDQDIKLCAICMDKNKSHALSCGHIYCEHCAKQLQKCSFCNKEITSVIKLFNLY